MERLDDNGHAGGRLKITCMFLEVRTYKLFLCKETLNLGKNNEKIGKEKQLVRTNIQVI